MCYIDYYYIISLSLSLSLSVYQCGRLTTARGVVIVTVLGFPSGLRCLCLTAESRCTVAAVPVYSLFTVSVCASVHYSVTFFTRPVSVDAWALRCLDTKAALPYHCSRPFFIMDQETVVDSSGMI